MRYPTIALGASLISAIFTASAGAQFSGGFADGMQQAQQLENLRKAQELDRRDGGRRYEDLRTRQQLDDIQQELRRNNQLLEAERTRRLIEGR